MVHTVRVRNSGGGVGERLVERESGSVECRRRSRVWGFRCWTLVGLIEAAP